MAALGTAAGNELFRQGRFAEAVEAYAAVANAAGADATLAVNAYSNMALCHLRLMDFAAALKACADGKQLDPLHAKLNYRLADALIAGGCNDADAIDRCCSDLAAALEAHPERSLHDQLARLNVQRWLRCPQAQLPRRPRQLLPIVRECMEPGSCSEALFHPSADGVDENLLVLLHGLGDSAAGFLAFGAGMELPQTAVLSLTGPHAVPLLGGGAWFAALNEETYEPLPAAAPHARRAAEAAAVADALYTSLCKAAAARRIRLAHVHVLGFGDGGTLALQLAVRAMQRASAAAAAAAGTASREGEPGAAASPAAADPLQAWVGPFASVTSIGGPLLPEAISAALGPAALGIGAATGSRGPSDSAPSPAAAPVLFMSSGRRAAPAASAAAGGGPSSGDAGAGSCAEATPLSLQTVSALRRLGFGRLEHTILLPPRRLRDDMRRKPRAADASPAEEDAPPARMPRGREEMTPLIAFLAGALRRRMVALEDDADFVELAPGEAGAAAGGGAAGVAAV